MSKRKKLIRGTCEDVTGIDISHGEPVWLDPNSVCSNGPGNPLLITFDLAAYRKRIARWKAEAKRLRRILNEIGRQVEISHGMRYTRRKP